MLTILCHPASYFSIPFFSLFLFFAKMDQKPVFTLDAYKGYAVFTTLYSQDKQGITFFKILW